MSERMSVSLAGLTQRPRRLRATDSIRRLVRETTVSVDDLLYPAFVWTEQQSLPIESMPGVSRHSIDDLCRTAESLAAARVPGLVLFGIPARKDDAGTECYAEDGVIARSIRAVRKTVGHELLLIPDLCLCEYTSHGHCGVLDRGDVDNDATLSLLARAAVCYAAAGADIVAPSDMMDGRVAAIRSALDEQGFTSTAILAYSAKYASAFYGPFREAADSSPAFGDRRTYQMDPANRREALREIALDVEQGADAVMVKPGLAYLDILRDARQAFDLPLAVYNVSGEYAMVKAAGSNGWIDEARIVDELMLAFRRAGADMIITYFALECALRWNR